MEKSKTSPSLKSASGGGFSFEDKVAALLFCEMLLAKKSVGKEYGIIQKLERQAADWEPFGDILLTIPTDSGKFVKCGCSVKSNQPVNTNGCGPELRSALWQTIEKPHFVRGEDTLALFSSPLPKVAHTQLNSLCRQARETDVLRLERKIVHQDHQDARKIYESFRHPHDSTDNSLPGHILAHLIPREFDFEDNASRDEAEALRLCREILHPSTATDKFAIELWNAMLGIAESLRVAGGNTTCERLAAKLRPKFQLRDDPSDEAAWTRIRECSLRWIGEIEMTLPHGLVLPRSMEVGTLIRELMSFKGLHVLGESGLGKSALVKAAITSLPEGASEIVWIKTEHVGQIKMGEFVEIAQRTRRKFAVLVFDAMESCYDADALRTIGKTIATLTDEDDSPWHIILICQTQQWSRISQELTKFLLGHAALTKRIDPTLSSEDFTLVCQNSPSVARLATQPHLHRLLALPKILDVLMTLELSKEQSLAGEADLVEWWWRQQVCGQQAAAVEEQVAKQFASTMADELRTELPRSAADSFEQAASTLQKRGVLRLTINGGFRFSHELFADWSRVMQLRSLGDDLFTFMRAHAENPPWLRAIRLFSQHLLERIEDFDHWRAVLGQVLGSAKKLEEVAAENLQVLDAWLEGIAFCTDPSHVLASVQSILFDQNGALLRRLLRRLLHVGTLPDPVIQEQWRKLDPELAEAASNLYRLPLHGIWLPIVQFLIANSEAATDYAPIEIADFGSMWARLAEYINQPWPEISRLVLANAEKELRREVAGVYRYDRGPQRLAGGHESRVRIYLAGLHTASQHPDRVSKFALKATGRIPWEAEDVTAKTEPEWLGKWFERPRVMVARTYIRTESSVESWPDGPMRRTSRDFFHAWFDYGVALNLYRHKPKTACEITLALLLAWPKSNIDLNSSHFEHERHGFNFDSDHMYPAFWAKGPFLLFLRANWQPAVEMIIRLINFATERYADWWPYDPPVSAATFATPHGKVFWSGNHQVFAWYRYHMNTAQVVTCAMMALEKWFDECIESKKSIADAIQLLYTQGHSLVFAGLLIALGKRHPTLFTSELKPLLFLRDLYLYDQQTVMNEFSWGGSSHESKREKELRHEWNQLPGRRTPLLDMCCQWFLQNTELAPIFEEVCANWRQKAAEFPTDSEDRVVWLRWASNFDRSMWKETVTPDGREAWSLERPLELRDIEAEKAFARRQSAMNLPMQCKALLDNREELSKENVNFIWERLQNWKNFEEGKSTDEDEWASVLCDPRHAQAGLLALLLCLGEKHLSDELRLKVENELRKLLASPPRVAAMSPDDIHDDGEGFLARCVVRCWAKSPANSEWRGWVAYFTAAYRYRTISTVFDEAFRVRSQLGSAYRELEAFVLAFASIRQKANRQAHSHLSPDTNVLERWANEWISRFSEGHGPNWPNSWAAIESLNVFPADRKTPHHIERSRRGYGFDTGVLLAAFQPRAPLSTARDESERQHWITVSNEILQAFLRTLPSAPVAKEAEQEDWGHQVCREDESVFDLIAARLFQCDENERGQLYKPILDLRPAAHYFISQFLSAVLLESMRTDPPQVARLLELWRDMAEYLFERPLWKTCSSHRAQEVWKDIFLYGTPFTTLGDECFKPLVQGMRLLYRRHVKAHLFGDAHDQSSFAGFLMTKAGECLLVDVFIWLRASWEKNDHWFWQKVAEHSNFARLLDYAWRHHFPEIRKNPDALKAFKTLTINLAAQQDPVALEVQRQIAGVATRE